jgi:hypothetical protein
MNNKICQQFCIFMRDTYINLFKKDILLLEKDNEIIDNKCMLFLIDKLYNINLKYLLKNEKINIVYRLDDLIFYDNYNKDTTLKIVPVILDAKLIITDNLNKDETIINILDRIKQYSVLVPIYIIVKLECYNMHDKLKITVLKSFSKKILEYDIVDILNKKLYEIL